MTDQQPNSPTPEGAPDGQIRSRRRLGQGLNALLGTGSREAERVIEAAAEATVDSNHIDLALIERNPEQPRKVFEENALKELTESIKKHGLLQPVLVRPHEGGYQLIAGERRWLASKEAGLGSIPCRVLELSDQNVIEAALEENLKREDLNAMEKAEAFAEYVSRFDISHEELGKRLSMDRTTVTNYIRLIDLTEEVKTALREDKISNGHARALLSLTEPEQQKQACQQIVTEGLSVRKSEKLVKEVQTGDHAGVIPFPGKNEKSSGQNQTGKPELSTHLQSLQEQLQQVIGAQLEIKLTTEESGKIIIPFSSKDDFERILGTLRRAA